MSSHDPISLPVLIDAAYHGVNREIARRLAAAGFPDITPAHAKVFEQMGADRTISDLADGAQITRQAMRELVLQLEERGYVKRTTKPTDRRAQIVHPTAKGRRCVDAAWKVLAELMRDWEASIGREGLDDLRELLGVVVARLERG